MDRLEVDHLIVTLECMLYALGQAHDSCINVILSVESDQDEVNQVYTIIDTIYKVMEVSGVKPEHYNAILNECTWYSDYGWDMYCNFAGYRRK